MNILKELFPYPQYDNKWHFRYFVSFVEEAIMNKDFFGYRGGRCEVWIDENQYNINEYRFLTKKRSFKRFANFLDFNHFNTIGLWLIKIILKYYYTDGYKYGEKLDKEESAYESYVQEMRDLKHAYHCEYPSGKVPFLVGSSLVGNKNGDSERYWYLKNKIDSYERR